MCNASDTVWKLSTLWTHIPPQVVMLSVGDRHMQEMDSVDDLWSSIRNQDIASTPNTDYNDIQGLAIITGLFYDSTSFDLDPLFLLPDDPTLAPSFAGNYRLAGISPAVDAGKDSFNSLPLDLGQQPRIQDPAIDMGSYEVPYFSLFMPMVFRQLLPKILIWRFDCL